LMLWDQTTTCGTDKPQLMRVIENWSREDWKSVILDEKYAPYIMLNPIAAWSSAGITSREAYRDGYAEVIGKMRGYGYNHTLAIDSYDCGQSADSFTYYTSDNSMKIGDYLFSKDPLRNLFFAFHAYGWGSNLDSNIDNIAASGWPWMITEHGNDFPDEIWKKTNDYGAGVLAWSWFGNGGSAVPLNMNCDFVQLCLSAYGKQVINDQYGVKNTAKTCNAFHSCTDLPPNNFETCAQLKSEGKCSERTMIGLCDMTCGKCTGCSDIPPNGNFSCAQQASVDG